MKLKTLSLAILALSTSAVATAGTFAPCTSHPVTIPCAHNAWHVLAEGLYIQPTNDDLEYLESESLDSQLRTRHAVQPKHRFAFRIEGGYHFGQGNDLTLNWMHFNKNYDASTRVATATDEGGVSDFGDLFAETKFKLDIINLEFGQHFDVGNNGDLRLHFGLQYLKLDTHLKRIAESLEVVDEEPILRGRENDKYLSEFGGFGTRVGVDWTYHLSEGFDLVSRAAASVVVGDVDTEVKRSSESFPLEEQDLGAWQPFIAKHKRRTIIPTMEGRVGLHWTHMGENMNLGIEGGYHVMGVYQSVHYLVVNPTLEAIVRPQQNISNYGQHGPYLNIVIASK